MVDSRGKFHSKYPTKLILESFPIPTVQVSKWTQIQLCSIAHFLKTACMTILFYFNFIVYEGCNPYVPHYKMDQGIERVNLGCNQHQHLL